MGCLWGRYLGRGSATTQQDTDPLLSKHNNVNDVYYACDRDTPDLPLEKAFAFVREEGKINLFKATGDLSDVKPLLVFCKNDTKLQEDMKNAKIQTRGGDDVMLIVITDRKGQQLVDTEITKEFGHNVCLFWDQSKKGFRTAHNGESLVWIRDFLQQFQIRSSVRLKRTDLTRRYIEKVKTGKEEGWYHILSPSNIAEELQKSTVVYFHKKAVELKKAVKTFHPPLILFSADNEGIEERVREFQRSNNLSGGVMTVVLCRQFQHREFASSDNSILSLCIDNVGNEVLDIQTNSTLAQKVKMFLKKNKWSQEDKNETRESGEHSDPGTPNTDTKTTTHEIRDSGDHSDPGTPNTDTKTTTHEIRDSGEHSDPGTPNTDTKTTKL